MVLVQESPCLLADEQFEDTWLRQLLVMCVDEPLSDPQSEPMIICVVSSNRPPGCTLSLAWPPPSHSRPWKSGLSVGMVDDLTSAEEPRILQALSELFTLLSEHKDSVVDPRRESLFFECLTLSVRR
mmetsp:Transcript_21453/g.62104  ORF Transcript_21453/g.62104 Transcript_21453/m.62104 type:complete len:127 (-) Transcript_21453:816-1196(-)